MSLVEVTCTLLGFTDVSGHSVKAKSARDLRADAIEKRLGLGKKDGQTTLDKSLQSTTRKNGKKKIEVASSSDIESEVESEDGYPSVLPVENEGQEIDELASSDSEGSGSPVPEIPEAERDLLRIDIAGQSCLSLFLNDLMLIAHRATFFRSHE